MMAGTIQKLVILACVLNYVTCKCNRHNFVQHANGTLQSPNYPHEYNKTVDCQWKLQTSDNESTALILHFVGLRLFFAKRNWSAKGNATRYCPHAYNLTINGEKTVCTRLVSPTTQPFCKAYYAHDRCKYQQGIQQCETKEKIKQRPMVVHYESNGLTSNDNIGPVFGFKINFNSIDCKPETEISTQPTTKQSFTAISKRGKEKQKLTQTSSADVKITVPNAPASGITTSVISGNLLEKNTSLLVKIVAPISACLFLIALLVFFLAFRRRRMHKLVRTTQRGNSNPTPTVSVATELEDHVDYAGSNTDHSEASAYSAVENNNAESLLGNKDDQSHQAQEGEVTIINQSDVTYSTAQNTGTKQTVQYQKTMVDNVLYGATGYSNGNYLSTDEAETVENILYGSTST